MLSAVVLASCSSTTVIKTTDPDVKIYVDDEYRGKGAVTHADQKLVGAATKITLRKAGCSEQIHIITRNEEFDVGACVGGVLVLVPFLWIMKYKPEHAYEFRCERQG